MITTRRTIIILGLVAALLPSAVWADRERDSDLARRAVERGEALALADILTRVRSDLGGEVVGVEFDRKRDRWIYEFKVIDLTGRLWEVYVDAATAAILKREGH
ncbi:PepSY domain-containing protein [Microvirga guangxiensis]|uniref:Peptidase propeptide and YPEB domain-containing protein n=1 Tax=Microvirga guangxiensis TaxID=549386 RepID=A0A1G5L140_9HYPH|nr:PepSY domain-containing protein [Microvirga guangxiensis]SCZ06582.1 Peptidase propeptide and YPEB domain-containing protein [Microvirga guangxiensis]